MKPEELEEVFGEDAYAEVGNILWRKFRVAFLFASLATVSFALYFLPSMRPSSRYFVAVAAVVYTTVATIYYVWSDLVLRCLRIELLRRRRHAPFSNGEIRGEVGAPVALQIAIALFIVVLGYIVLGVVFGAAYFGTASSTADGSLVDSIYFSFVTLGTVGYGDFQPHGFGKLLVCIHTVSYLLYQATAIGGVIAIISKITTEPGTGLGYEIKDDDQNVA